MLVERKDQRIQRQNPGAMKSNSKLEATAVTTASPLRDHNAPNLPRGVVFNLPYCYF